MVEDDEAWVVAADILVVFSSCGRGVGFVAGYLEILKGFEFGAVPGFKATGRR